MLAMLCVAIMETGCGNSSLRQTASETWFHVRTPHFDVRTNFSEEDATDLGRDLEDIFSVLGTSPWLGGRPPHYECAAIVLSGPRPLREISEKVSGFFSSDSPFGPMVVASVPNSAWENSTLKHEVTHSYQHSFTYWMPAWLTEGMATFMATVEYDRDTELAVFGRPQRHWALGPRLRGRDILAQAGYHRVDARSYASGGLLVHFLASEYPQDLLRYTVGLATGRATPFEQAFPIHPDDLHDALNSYLLRGRYVARTLKVKRFDQDVHVNVLPNAYVHLTLAYLYAATPHPTLDEVERLDRLRKQLREARLADPDIGDNTQVARFFDLKP